ncbi:hypothetical protein CMsap09_15675 [Clavibacter michiganensis]|uniref:Uncharacterized protein n=1 Tax=Clavibacter michiganensis TaxID=28447 RepID=A0A251XYP3_9MICO|nr:hypothetical protein CMsap09_15675 [Clavibacter michiganensis]
MLGGGAGRVVGIGPGLGRGLVGDAVLGIHVVLVRVVEQLVERVRADDLGVVVVLRGVGVEGSAIVGGGVAGGIGIGVGRRRARAHPVGAEQAALGGARDRGERIHPAVRVA